MWPLGGKTAHENQEVRLLISGAGGSCCGQELHVRQCLTLVINRRGDHWAESVLPAVLPLELTLKAQTHRIHVHVLDAF